MSANTKNAEKPTIEVICPIYNGAKHIKRIDYSLKSQTGVNLAKINYILTESTDKSEEIMKDLGLKYTKIKAKDFSHSLTREKAAMKSKADIVVFLTQDVEIIDDTWLKNLTVDVAKSIKEHPKAKKGDIVAAFSRQISKYNNLEKYTREKNYPERSRVTTRADVDKLGVMAFFSSDASACIRTDVFKNLNGYDGRKFCVSEDMYISYKVIMAGYAIKYCAKSVVRHSHKFTLKQTYYRYKQNGEFMKQNPQIAKYGTSGSGMHLATYALKRSIQDKNFKATLRWLPDMAARYLGMKAGQK